MPTPRSHASIFGRPHSGAWTILAIGPHEVLDLQIMEMVARENAEGNLKELRSGLHPRFVEPGGWQRDRSEEDRPWYAGRR